VNVNDNNIMVRVDDLYKHFTSTKGVFKKGAGTVKAVDGVSFYIKRGEALALVGESGCGKTTTGRCILGAIKPTSGSVYFTNMGKNKNTIDITKITNKHDLKNFRRSIGMIFQDPFSSLNPRMKISDILSEPFINHGMYKSKRDLQEKVTELMCKVNIDPAYMNRYPHAFSGGQRQRIAIGRALALDPEFIVADEPVSALDVSVQAQILNMLINLQKKFNLTYLLIGHNLAVVEYISNRVAVMYLGKIVELADTEVLFHNPKHPYTEALLAVIPEIDTGRKERKILLKGEIVDSESIMSGCHFYKRCKYAEDICMVEEPTLLDKAKVNKKPHYVACHFVNKLKLAGIK